MSWKKNSPNWQGKVQPKRDRCPKCSKRGLGPLKDFGGGIIGQNCRYCQHVKVMM